MGKPCGRLLCDRCRVRSHRESSGDCPRSTSGERSQFPCWSLLQVCCFLVSKKSGYEVLFAASRCHFLPRSIFHQWLKSLYSKGFRRPLNKWSRVESNHYLRLRRPSSYPLDHGTSAIALGVEGVTGLGRLGKEKDFQILKTASGPKRPRRRRFERRQG